MAPMLDKVRTSLHRALTTPVGDGFLPVRVPKDLVRRVNSLLGDPICSQDEIERRKSGRIRLEELKKQGPSAKRTPSPKIQAPVVVYFEREQNLRMVARIKELLDSKGIRYSESDVAEDDVTRNFVLRTARVDRDQLPVVFVATSPIGSYQALVDADVSGRLEKALFGP
jgi:glutaredoxin